MEKKEKRVGKGKLWQPRKVGNRFETTQRRGGGRGRDSKKTAMSAPASEKVVLILNLCERERGPRPAKVKIDQSCSKESTKEKAENKGGKEGLRNLLENLSRRPGLGNSESPWKKGDMKTCTDF